MLPLQSRLRNERDFYTKKFIEKTERKYKQVPEIVTTISDKTSVSFFRETKSVRGKLSILRIYNEEFDPGSG